jgi:hypothetical protein
VPSGAFLDDPVLPTARKTVEDDRDRPGEEGSLGIGRPGRA